MTQIQELTQGEFLLENAKGLSTTQKRLVKHPHITNVNNLPNATIAQQRVAQFIVDNEEEIDASIKLLNRTGADQHAESV
jgi:hypothetical protein